MEELLTINELAKLLKASPWTIRTWCSQKYVPYFKLRGLVRFRASDIEKWLKKNLIPGRVHHIFINQFANRVFEERSFEIEILILML